MKIKILLLLVMWLMQIRCATNPKPELLHYQDKDLLSDLTTVLKNAESAELLNATNCMAELDKIVPALAQKRLYDLDLATLPLNGPKLMQLSFQLRLTLNDRLNELATCRTQIREVMFRTRALEDLLGEKLYGPGRAMSSSEISFSKGPTPILNDTEFKGYLTRAGFPVGAKYEFRAGDLLLEKGNSFISAMLSNAVAPRGHLSHFALVQIDAITKKPITIESFIQSGGVAKFDMIEALKKYNVRIVVVRPRNSEAAAMMAQAVDEKVEEEKKSGKKIKYDFAIDFSDDSQMSCSELVLWGYRKSSGGQLQIPAEYSELNESMKKILSYVGVKPGKVLTPMDIEVDPNFQILTEFRDYRLLRESRFRDAIFKQMMDWMLNKSYLFPRKPPKVDVAAMIQPMRRSGLPTPRNEKGELDVPSSFIEVMRRANDVSDILLKQLRERDAKFMQETGWPMTNELLETEVENIRLEDLVKYKKGEAMAFHHLLRPFTYWELTKEVFR